MKCWVRVCYLLSLNILFRKHYNKNNSYNTTPPANTIRDNR